MLSHNCLRSIFEFGISISIVVIYVFWKFQEFHLNLQSHRLFGEKKFKAFESFMFSLIVHNLINR